MSTNSWPDRIQVDISTRTFYVQTNDYDHIGNYNFIITGTLVDYPHRSIDVDFVIRIRHNCMVTQL